MFTTLEGPFEPMVMFFRLINFLVISQMMINKILWYLINMGKVASFIDDIIIEKKCHDEMVKEIVRRLVENDLYIKPKKYKWKVY